MFPIVLDEHAQVQSALVRIQTNRSPLNGYAQGVLFGSSEDAVISFSKSGLGLQRETLRSAFCSATSLFLLLLDRPGEGLVCRDKTGTRSIVSVSGRFFELGSGADWRTL